MAARAGSPLAAQGAAPKAAPCRSRELRIPHRTSPRLAGACRSSHNTPSSRPLVRSCAGVGQLPNPSSIPARPTRSPRHSLRGRACPRERRQARRRAVRQWTPATARMPQPGERLGAARTRQSARTPSLLPARLPLGDAVPQQQSTPGLHSQPEADTRRPSKGMRKHNGRVQGRGGMRPATDLGDGMVTWLVPNWDA